MFNNIPNLFGRSFTTGYFLPALLGILATVGLLGIFGLVDLSPLSTVDILALITSTGIAAWVLGVLLAALNWEIVRFFEGYGTLNPLRLFTALERLRYDRLHRNLERLRIESVHYKSRNQPWPNQKRFNTLSLSAVTDFPEQRDMVIGTPLGNTLRAFETYTLTMYDAEAITLWPRLQAVMDESFAEIIDGAKAQFDFWVNLSLLSILLFMFTGILIVVTGIQSFMLMFLPIIVLYVTFSRARRAAAGWGELVKAAFDIYLPVLAAKLGYRLPLSRKEEREFWDHFSIAITYRLPGYLRDRQETPKPASEGRERLLEPDEETLESDVEDAIIDETVTTVEGQQSS